jgi:phosphotransferase system HPr (HPr) family protein
MTTGATADKTGPLRRTVRVSNPLGLHYRAADRFARAARQFSSTVTVWNGESRANGRDLIELILLVALPGTDLVLEVEGPDAPAALESLADILGAPSGEDYTI